jgi:hypothetical protein
MKQTLLEMTQDILSAMSSDEVNSISDTSEALQVATIIKHKYFDIINRVPLPEHEQLIQLDPSLDIDIPVMMYVPEHVADLKWLKYYNSNTSVDTDNGNEHDINVDLEESADQSNPAPGYEYVTILPINQFIDMVNSFNTEESNVETFAFVDNSNDIINGTYNFNYKTDTQPSYCTILSNYYVIFDSYDNTQDSTLQARKSMGMGRIIPHWSMTDNFTPNLAEEQFQLLLNEAKALAFFELKQQPHQLAMQEAKRGWSNVQKNKAVINRPTYFNELPNFGRRSGVYYGTRGFGNGYSQGWNQWQ